MHPRRDPARHLLSRARGMRHAPTDAERRLWALLRARQLANFKFRRQHPIANYILDFYCPSHHLAIEADGGHHLDPSQLAYDTHRTQTLSTIGIKILRVPDDQILKFPTEVAATIYNALIPD